MLTGPAGVCLNRLVSRLSADCCWTTCPFSSSNLPTEHPDCMIHDRYKTEMCRDGMNCKRKVCFFAHRLDELRAPSPVTIPSSSSLSTGEMETAGGGLSSELTSDPSELQALQAAGRSEPASSLAGMLTSWYDCLWAAKELWMLWANESSGNRGIVCLGCMSL